MKTFIFKKNSIQNKLFISYFLLVTFTIIILDLSFYKLYLTSIENEIGKSRVDVLKQVSQNVSSIINGITSVSNLYIYDDKILDIFKKPLGTERFRAAADSNALLELITKYNHSVDNLNLNFYSIIYSFGGQRICSLNNEQYNFDSIPGMPWYKKAFEKDGKIFWTNTYKDILASTEDKYIFSAVRILKHDLNGKPIGVVIINADEENIFNAYKNILQNDNTVFVIDPNGNVISHSDKNKLGTNLFKYENLQSFISDSKIDYLKVKEGNKQILVSKSKISGTDWVVVEKIPIEVLLSPMKKMNFFIILILGVCVFAELVLSYLVAKIIAMPIKSLYTSMEEVKDGNLSVVSNIKSHDEIGKLSENFNTMLLKINQLINGIRIEEGLKRKAELDFLQAQINPHFLYNTLYSIRCIVNMKDNDRADKMLASFIHLLRKTYQNDDALITIGEEIDCLRDYINIQKIRYEGKFEVAFCIHEDILNFKIIKLILQPLVENAIFHGIDPMGQKGIVTIRGYIENDDIIFKIEDNGIGMSQEQVYNMFRGKKFTGSTMNSIGLANVDERIKMNFGVNYGLSIASEEGKGTTILVRIPVIGTSAEGVDENENTNC